MKREYYFRLPCTHEGCKEAGIYSYSTRREYAEGMKRNKTWTCTRHSKPKEVLSIDNPKTEAIIICKQLLFNGGPQILGKFWQDKENIGTEKCNSGFQYGNGYRAYASDFPEGTIIKITAEVILPENLSNGTD
jgi:hypothetical protein